MDKDRAAVKLSLEQMAKSAILGIFGTKDEDTMIARMHTTLDFADNLRIDDFKVTVTLKELRAVKKEYEKDILAEDDDE